MAALGALGPLLGAILAAEQANGTEDEATALAALDAALRGANESVAALAAEIAANRIAALSALHDRFVAKP